MLEKSLAAEGEAGVVEQPQTLVSVLEQAVECLDGLEEDDREGREQLVRIQQRLAEGQFRLAVLGQFKRGKSTLLNALLGEALLPTDILPVTAIPTFIRSASTVTARVDFIDDGDPVLFPPDDGRSLGDFLHDYVTEAGNPDNRRGVKQVEIGHPSPLLEQGVVLIDTPGVGSTYRHNTEVAYQILSECDAALFLVSPDPPLTASELDYLQEIRQCLPRTFFLLNKVDFLDEQQRRDSLRFLAEQLTPLCQGSPQILAISARQGLQARLESDADAWKSSGLHDVERNLVDFFAREKQQTLMASLRMRTGDQLHHCLMQLRLAHKALLLPEADLEEKIAQFRKSLNEVQRERQAAEDLLKGDLNRALKHLDDEMEAVRERAYKVLLESIEEPFRAQADTEEMERQVRAALARKIPEFFAPELHQVSQQVRRTGISFLELHQQRCNTLIEQVRKIAADLFAIPYRAPLAGQSYLDFSPPAWSSELFISDLDPLGQRFSRRFLTRQYRRRKTIKRLREESRKLVNQNLEQIHWSLRRGLDESFRHYGAELSEQLDHTVEATSRAMDLALERHRRRALETAAQEQSLEDACRRFEKLLEQIDV